MPSFSTADYDEGIFTRGKLLDKYTDVIDAVEELEEGKMLIVDITSDDERMIPSIREYLKKQGTIIRARVDTTNGKAYIAVKERK